MYCYSDTCDNGSTLNDDILRVIVIQVDGELGCYDVRIRGHGVIPLMDENTIIGRYCMIHQDDDIV